MYAYTQVYTVYPVQSDYTINSPCPSIRTTRRAMRVLVTGGTFDHKHLLQIERQNDNDTNTQCCSIT